MASVTSTVQTSQAPSVLSDIYTGTAGFGAVMADLKAIFGCIIGLILIIVGLVLLFRKVTRSASLSATISNVNCVSSNINGNTQYNCSYTAIYTLDQPNQTLSVTNNISSTILTNGSTITLYYDPTNHSDISTTSGDYRIIGWICIGLGILIAISVIVWAYLANKYKAIGAAEGVISGVGIIRNVFR